MIIKSNTPIINSEGEILAFLANDMEWGGQLFEWTWFSPLSKEDYVGGPMYADLGETIPVNRGTLHIEYRRGPFVVLGCDLRGDTQSAFNNRLFRKPDELVGETWRGKLAAVKVLREYLKDPMTVMQLDRLEEMFEHYATKEAS